jgi:hypothetical protein
MILDSQSRGVLSLLFDKIICHFPVANMACGGGHGTIDDFSDELLVKVGIIELREYIHEPDINPIPSDKSVWGTDENFDLFLKSQVTLMALNACTNENAVPITDDPNWPIPGSLIHKMDITRFARLQAGALAMESINILIPSLANLEGEEILIVREKLKEQLIPFRNAMLRLAPLVREGIKTDASPHAIFKEASYVVETTIAPLMEELRNRVSKERERFWRKVLIKAGVIAPKIILNWASQNAIKAAIESFADAKDIIEEIVAYDRWTDAMISTGGIGFLLSIKEYVEDRLAIPRA